MEGVLFFVSLLGSLRLLFEELMLLVLLGAGPLDPSHRHGGDPSAQKRPDVRNDVEGPPSFRWPLLFCPRRDSWPRVPLVVTVRTAGSGISSCRYAADWPT